MISRNAATAAGLLALALWSTSVAATRLLEERLGALATGSCTCLISGLTLYAAQACRLRSWSRPLAVRPAAALACGVPFVLYLLGYTVACGLPAAARVPQVGLANYLWPAFMLLFSVPLLGHRARWRLLLPGSALALAGVGLAAAEKTSALGAALREEWPAFLIMTAAAAAWALYSNLARKLYRPGDPNMVASFQLAAGLAFLLGYSLFGGKAEFGPDLLPGLAYLALAVGAAGYFCWETGMKHGDQTLLTACSYFTPVASTLVSCLALRQPVGTNLLFGCALVIAGACLCRKGIVPAKNGEV